MYVCYRPISEMIGAYSKRAPPPAKCRSGRVLQLRWHPSPRSDIIVSSSSVSPKRPHRHTCTRSLMRYRPCRNDLWLLVASVIDMHRNHGRHGNDPPPANFEWGDDNKLSCPRFCHVSNCKRQKHVISSENKWSKQFDERPHRTPRDDEFTRCARATGPNAATGQAADEVICRREG